MNRRAVAAVPIKPSVDPGETGSQASQPTVTVAPAMAAPLYVRLRKLLEVLGLNWFVPLVNLGAGENPRAQIRELWLMVGVPLAALVVFLLCWHWGAARVETSLGVVPGPVQVWTEAKGLMAEHRLEREKAAEFIVRQEQRNAERLAADPTAEVRIRPYTGRPTYPSQILTSLYTVFTGFLLATLLAVPVGILCGMSRIINTALNPLIQIFKPVSPLAWLPIVTMVVSAVYAGGSGAWFEKSFLVSAVTVTLCSLWPTLINTAVGVASIDRDLINVGRVLKLNKRTQITRIILPSSLPLIFTGLRLSLGVGWMVLIAAEMLAQNPGLGKFVWDEFQNGSSSSLGRIMVAVLTIGIIGFLLDRVMLTLQKLFSFGEVRA